MSARMHASRPIILGTTVLLAILFTAVAIERSRPAHAQAGSDIAFWGNLTYFGIAPSQALRVCVGHAAGAPGRMRGIAVALQWMAPDGSALLTKRLPVPDAGFQCVDTGAEELRLAGFPPEASGRVQSALHTTVQAPGDINSSDVLISGEVFDAQTGATSHALVLVPRAFGLQ